MDGFQLRFTMFALAWLLYPCLVAAATERPTIQIPRAARPPRLEDFVERRSSGAEARVSGFRQRDPNDGEPVSRETNAYLSYDNDNLYVIFVCDEEPKNLRARLGRRDQAFGDDMVSVNLDTFHDGRRAYMFFVNPLGVQLDGVTAEGQEDDFSVDMLWYSEGRLTPEGYIVRLAIPFKSLRFSNTPQQTWGIALTRYTPRNREFSTWPYITNNLEGFVGQFAVLEGIQGVSPGRNLQLTPYGFLAGQRFLDTAGDGPAFVAHNEGRNGMDAKLVLRDAWTLDLTGNPDFSQVESDEPQVTINERFESYFPEKRPFFLENADLFETPETLFFSRRIADPQWGARLTGKAGKWRTGWLGTNDRAAGRLLKSSDPRAGKSAQVQVLRMQREVARQSTVGILATSRDFASEWNRVVALDARLKLNANWVMTAQAMRSDDRVLAGGRHAGSAYYLQLRHEGRHLEYYSTFRERSPDFRTTLGFITRTDLRQSRNVVAYRWKPENSRLLSFGPSLVSFVNWDTQGQLQDWYVETPFRLEFKGPTTFVASRSEAYELYRGTGFRKHSNYFYVSSNRLKWLGITGSYTQGASVNFFPAAGLEPFSARSQRGELEFTLRPTRRTRLDETYLYNRLSTAGISPLPGVAPSATIFTNHLLRTKLNYQFTRALSLRAILDYNSVLPEESLVDLERAKGLTLDLLATYQANPSTAIYVGYSDRYENLAFDPGTSPAMHRSSFPGLSTGRQFFIKASYLLRF